MDDVTSVVRALLRLASMLTKPPQTSRPADVDNARIAELFRERRGDVMVTASGRIVRVLPDDRVTADGTGEHQRFLVELSGGAPRTVKLSHNLAFGRVPARVGQRITFRGEYAYNDLGGAVHWTHRDPKHFHEDGWIEIDGRRFG